ncbi:putative NAD(P)H quinone oxidoreductase, PIG3 family [Paenibacillus sp. UNC496MF]|uniref:NAD(P)H-quinone oxidoreductase n=1 Tax=Paenibacillus sp. UNC496MF TaxID=1502753 RepID=UPI0008EC89D5|nr:NAD(P)H-quinone oxidoreductase [Paenibacillus sp. UNC496MF]SFJ36213.1 putative NAD(P)H quinone oxidoreductase, PIG3 family [Paenibacillus sp. UNC496MF]
MKAILVDDQTKQLYLGEAGEPSVSAGELLVSVKATALNRADLLQKRGLYPPPPGASEILGLEMAGVVEKAGADVKGWEPGDRVFGLLPGGGYAERVAIPAGMAMRIPDHLSFEQAAAIPEVFLTAYLNLFVLGGLREGHDVLIHAGASGVGTAAIQLVREAGAASIVTAGTREKRDACLALGAGLAIDYTAGPFVQAVQEATDGRGANLIMDFIGAPYWQQNMASLATDGKLIVIGTMGGSKVSELDLGFMLRKRLQVIGTALRSQPVSAKIKLTEQFARFAMPRFADGRLKPIVDTVWARDQANEAHARMEKNQNTGKIILRIQE